MDNVNSENINDVEELVIKNEIIIDNVDSFKKGIFHATGHENIDIEEIKEFVLSQEGTMYYFDNSLNSTSEKEAKMLWIDTGYVGAGNETVFVSLLKYGYNFVGHITGTGKYLMEYTKKRVSFKDKVKIEGNYNKFIIKYNKKIIKREKSFIVNSTFTPARNVKNIADGISSNVTDTDNVNSSIIKETNEYTIYVEPDFINEIYNMLLINQWTHETGLRRYIIALGKRLTQIYDGNDNEYYVVNKLKSAIINSGLINTFGQDILLLYRYNFTYEIFEPYSIIDSKAAYIENDFTKEQSNTKLKPIKFVDDNKDLELNASIDDFDLSLRNLVHIIENRKDRFPENIQNQTDSKIAERLQINLQRNLTLLLHDKSYAKPIYSCKRGDISWVMPFYINNSYPEEPELAMVIYKVKDFYEIKTVLPYDNILKDRITELSLYKSIW